MTTDTKLLDRILGLLVAVELIFLVWLSYPALEAMPDIYKGFPLIALTLRITLHFSLGILAVIQLFRESLTAKWFFLSYIAIAVVEKFWRINSNTEKYITIVREAQTAIAQGSASVATIVSVFHYPSWWTWLLYCAGLFYMFIIRQRYNKSHKRDAA